MMAMVEQQFHHQPRELILSPFYHLVSPFSKYECQASKKQFSSCLA